MKVFGILDLENLVLLVRRWVLYIDLFCMLKPSYQLVLNIFFVPEVKSFISKDYVFKREVDYLSFEITTVDFDFGFDIITADFVFEVDAMF